MTVGGNTHQGRRRGALLRIVVGQLISWGTLYYGLTFLAEPIQEETDWGLPPIFGAFSGGLLVAALCAPLVGKFISRWGGRACLTVGSLLASAALTVIALSPAFPVFVFGWLFAGVAMAATLYEAGFSALRESSGAEFRRQVSVLAIFSGLASTLAWPLSAGLLAVVDWRTVFLGFAALQLGVAAPVHGSLPRRQAEDQPGNTTDPTPASQPGPRVSRFDLWMAAMAFALAALLSGALSAHLAVLLSAQGVGSPLILWAAVLVGPMQILARALDWMWHGAYSIRLLGLVALGLPPLGIALLLSATSWPIAALAFAVLYGAGHGLVTIVKAIIPTLVSDSASYARLTGWLAAPGLIARAIAPALTAVMLEITSPTLTLLTLMVLGTLSVGLFMVCSRNGPPYGFPGQPSFPKRR